MKTSITYRFFLAILLASGLAVTSLVVITQWNLNRGFLRFVRETEQASSQRLSATLEDYYAQTLSWTPLIHDGELWQGLVLESLLQNGVQLSRPNNSSGELVMYTAKHPLPPHVIDDFGHRFALLDHKKNCLLGPELDPGNMELTPLTHKTGMVGYLALKPTERLTNDRHLDFLRRQKSVFVLVAIITVLLAAGLSLLIARRLVRPIKELAAATHQLASGEFSSRVPVSTKSELGQLASDFNMLALTLEKNEQSRRQWIADISHELRTPIGILRGEIEALMDGVRLADFHSLESLHAETMRLSRLVCDLYQLSMSDLGALSYRKEKVNITALLHDVVDSYKDEMLSHRVHFFGISSPTRPIYVFADPERLRQLFFNLIDNSMKYTDPGGYLKIITSKGKETLEINIQDSAPSVPEEALDKLFDRFFRVESSRCRDTGGAGLGLAICSNIIEAHRGVIKAEKSPLGGLWIKITLPHLGKKHG